MLPVRVSSILPFSLPPDKIAEKSKKRVKVRVGNAGLMDGRKEKGEEQGEWVNGERGFSLVLGKTQLQ